MVSKPQSYLAPQSQPWGRFVEQSLTDLEKGISINGQNSNNNLRQLNSSVQLLSEQQVALAEQQAALAAQEASLAAIVAEQVVLNNQQQAQLNFINSQTVFDSKTTSWSANYSNAGYILLPFDSTYDAQVQQTTTSSGKLNISSSSQLFCGGTNPSNVGIAVEALWSGGSFLASVGQCFSPPGTTFSGYTLPKVFPANTTITVRLRRFVNSYSGTATYQVQNQSLVVTKIP